jgi:hypothetical protein
MNQQTTTLYTLEEAIALIRKTKAPDEVFSTTELRHFFEDNYATLENKLPQYY